MMDIRQLAADIVKMSQDAQELPDGADITPLREMNDRIVADLNTLVERGTAKIISYGDTPNGQKVKTASNPLLILYESGILALAGDDLSGVMMRQLDPKIRTILGLIIGALMELQGSER